MMLAIGVQTKKTGHVPADDKIISTALETLQENGIVSGVVSSKGLCEIDLDTVIRDLPIPTKYEVIEIGKEVIYKPFSLYPAIVRDIALWVDASIKKEEVQIIIEDSVRITQEHHLKTKNIIKQFARWFSYEFIRMVFYLFTFYFKHKA